METIDKIKTHIANGETEEAIQLLVKYTKDTNSPKYDDAVLLSGQYQQWRRETALGVQQSSNDLRRIELTIMDILQEKSKMQSLKSKPRPKVIPPKPPAPEPQKSKSSLLPFLIGGLVVLLLGVGYFVLGEDDGDYMDDIDQANIVDVNQEPNSAIDDAQPTTATSSNGANENPEENLVKGEDVNFVDFGKLGSDPIGSFIHEGDGIWIEEGPNGEARFTFIEQKRDEWSVYLFDESRKAQIQLDIYAGKIKFKEQDGEQLEIYDILNWTD